MPPTFQETSFVFEDGEQVPEHVEGWPQLGEQGGDKWWLRGTDTFSYEDYVELLTLMMQKLLASWHEQGYEN